MVKTWVDESGVSLLTDATAQAHSAALRIIESGRLSVKMLYVQSCLVLWQMYRKVSAQCACYAILQYFWAQVHWAKHIYCLHAFTDPLFVKDMYYRCKSNLQLPDWVAVRGTTKLEGYHPHLARALPGTGFSPDTADGIFALVNMQWSLECGAENKGNSDTGTVEPRLQNNLMNNPLNCMSAYH